MKERPDFLSFPVLDLAEFSISMTTGYDINHLIQEAHNRWLKPPEVLFILQNHESYKITQQTPQKPPSGSLFLFNKRVHRFFRKDGHNWRKKKDGRSVGEAHERLKVGNVESLNCYYAHGEDDPNFQRRSYWMLDPAYEHIVLVHYRDISEGKPNSRSISTFSPGQSNTLSPSVNNHAVENQGTASFSDLYGSYQSLSSPGSVEVSSQAVAERQRMKDFNDLSRAGNVSNLPKVEVKQVLRRLEEQLSLDDDGLKEFASYDNDRQDIDGTAVLGYDKCATKSDHGATLQQQQYYDGDDGLVSGSTDHAAWQDLASLLIPQEAENLNLQACSSDITAYNTDISEYYSVLPDQGQFQMLLEADSSLTIACEQKFRITEISPEWGFANETTKVIIVGSFLCNPSEIAWACMFGDIEVPVQIIQDGVLSCLAPSNCPGRVTFCITSGNREACSEVKDFEYRDRLSACDNCSNPQQEENRSVDELLLLVRFAQMLLSDSPLQEGEGNDLEVDPSRIQKGCEDSWFNVIQALLTGSGTSSGTIDWILQELLKDKLQQLLSARFLKGDDNSGCTLSKKEQGIIHIIAGLGYEWALNAILDSGVGVNFRDINGWTALHWAARFGREKMVAALIASGASPGAVTDATAQDPVGKTPASIADASGHKGLAGYLSELALTSHLSSLTFEETEMSKGCADVEAEATVSSIARESVASGDEQDSMKHTLVAVRNAAQAAARIQAAFRAHSFRKRHQREAAISAGSGEDEYGFTSDEIQGLSAASKLVFRHLHDHDLAALSIQKNYRSWKGRKDFLTLRQKVVKIQAHVRGYQVRKKYKVICWAVGILDKAVLRWRRKGAGLRGYKPDADSIDENEEYEDMLKVFRRQKVDVPINEAVSRVLSMVNCPEARQQYTRMLERFQEAKVELGALTNEEASTSQADVLAMDDDDIFQFLESLS